MVDGTHCFVILASRVMVGGRIYSKGEVVIISSYSLMRAAIRSGAVRALASGIAAQLDITTFFNEGQTLPLH